MFFFHIQQYDGIKQDFNSLLYIRQIDKKLSCYSNKKGIWVLLWIIFDCLIYLSL